MMNITRSHRLFKLFPALLSATLMACAASNAVRDQAPALAKSPSDPPAGYLPANALPDSLALLPPPPQAASPAFALDEDYSRKSFALHNTPAWTLAILDSDTSFPNAAGTFSCALNAPITEQDTPHLYTLLRRTLIDAGASTKAAKSHHDRTRPFVLNNATICTIGGKDKQEKSSSYPSGHNAAGMAWALVLAEVSPQQADAILARGQAYGVSRIVCNVHWYSDTIQGRFMGAYTVAKLHSEPAFRADVEAAKAELQAIRAKGLKATRDCKAEAEAMALQQTLYR
jgi:acid phosphatase (class A)